MLNRDSLRFAEGLLSEILITLSRQECQLRLGCLFIDARACERIEREAPDDRAGKPFIRFRCEKRSVNSTCRARAIRAATTRSNYNGLHGQSDGKENRTR